MFIIWIIAIVIFLGAFAVFVNVIKNWRTRLKMKKFLLLFSISVSLITLLFYFVESSYWVILMGYGFVVLFSVLLSSSKQREKVS